MKDTEKPDTAVTNREQRISALAYQIWEEEGRPDGRDEVHWFLACQMVDAENEEETIVVEGEETLPAWLNKQATEAKPENRNNHHDARKKSAA